VFFVAGNGKVFVTIQRPRPRLIAVVVGRHEPNESQTAFRTNVTSTCAVIVASCRPDWRVLRDTWMTPTLC